MARNIGPSIVRDNLVLCLDAGNTKSYPGSGDTWYDISGKGNHAEANTSMPSFYSNGALSYFQFDGATNECITQISTDVVDIIDLFVITRFEFSGDTPNRMLLSKKGVDRSFRLKDGGIRNSNSSSNFENQNQTKTFVGLSTTSLFNPTNATGSGDGTATYVIRDKWAFIRVTTTDADFTSGILYEIGTSSGYDSSRNYYGKVNMVFAYDRELTTAEVLQNFHALKRRFG
tara:strand:+ start:389 stop:1078 length:690 start_codon:yes stop_codon:yes gene_type:complete